MARKLKALQALSLLTAVSGASVLLLSAGSAPAQAAEERLHNEAASTYGLLLPAAASAKDSLSEGGDGAAGMSVASLGATVTKGGPGKTDVPDIEDPELPGYDGGEAPTAAKASR